MDLSRAYEILKVNQNDDFEKIKKMYKELCKKYHPDLYQDENIKELTEEKLKEVNEAYEILEKYYNEEKNKPITEFFTELDSEGKELYFDKKTRKKITGKIFYVTLANGKGISEVKNGYREGLTTISYENGNDAYKKNYVEGIISGEVLTYTYGENHVYTKRECYLKGIKHGKEEYFSSTDLKYSKKIKEYKHGKEIDLSENNSIILKMEDIEVLYKDDYREGKAKLYYTDGVEEVKYIRGKITGFSTFYRDSGEIEKYYYSHGRKNKEVIKRLRSYPIEYIYNFKYKKDNKEYIVGIKNEEYIFYNCLRKIYNLKDEIIIDKINLKDSFYEYLALNESLLLEFSETLPLNEMNFSHAKANDTNFDLLKELEPVNLEDFARKIRARDIVFKFDDFNNEITSVYITNENIDNLIMNTEQKIVTLFLKEFYPECKNYSFYEIPAVLTTEYWISVFKEAIEKENISDELIEILNIILKDEVEVINLLNIYIGLKYKMYSFVMEAIENLKNLEEYDEYYLEEILEDIFKIKNIDDIEDFIMCLEYLLDHQKIEVDITQDNLMDLKYIYEQISNFIFEIEKNKIFISYKDEINNSIKELKLFNSKIKILEEEIDNERKKKMELKIQELENFLLNLKLNYSEINIEKDKNDIENIEKKIEFISELKNDELEIINKLGFIKKFSFDKKNIYSQQKEEIKKTLIEKSNSIKEDKKNRPLGTLIFTIIAGYLGIKNLGFLLGILAIVGTPIVLSFFYSDEDKKNQKELDELKNYEKKLNYIIDKLNNILKILEPFSNILYNDNIIEVQENLTEIKNIKPRSKKFKLIFLIILLFGIGYYLLKDNITNYLLISGFESIPKVTNEKILNQDIAIEITAYDNEKLENISKGYPIRYSSFKKKDKQFGKKYVYFMFFGKDGYTYRIACSREGILSMEVYAGSGNFLYYVIPDLEIPTNIFSYNIEDDEFKLLDFKNMSTFDRENVKAIKEILSIFKEFLKNDISYYERV